MNYAHPLVSLLCSIVVCTASTGCSVLGFSAYPIAHSITDDTKAVLSQSASMPHVARELSKTVPSSRSLQPGDQLLIEATKEEPAHRIPADQTVLTDGSIDLGYYGRIVVAGMTQEEAESAIQRLVYDAEKQSISLNVQVSQPIDRFYVVGEVNSPGAYSLQGYETVLDAILKAGGLTNRASACDLLLARPSQPCDCRVTLSVCYRAITQLGDSTTNYHLKPGDRIFVARQSLCEELCGFLKPGKTCERCCARQCPCPDPSLLDTDSSSFVQPEVQIIASPRPPRGADAAANVQEKSNGVYQPEPARLPVEPAGEPSQPPQLSVPFNSNGGQLEPLQTEPFQTGPRHTESLLDGELDFESF